MQIKTQVHKSQRYNEDSSGSIGRDEVKLFQETKFDFKHMDFKAIGAYHNFAKVLFYY